MWFLDQSLKLKPFTETVIQADTQAGLRTVGPTKEMSQSESGGIMVGKTLVNLKDGYVTVRIVNLSPGKKKLRRMTEIAVCEPCVSITTTSTGNDHEADNSKTELPDLLQDL